MTKDKVEKKEGRKKIDWALTLAIISIIISMFLFYAGYQQVEKINTLSRGNLNNDIIPYFILEDVTREINTPITLELKIESNYEGKMPVHIELKDIMRDDKSIKDFSFKGINKKQEIISESTSGNFNGNFTAYEEGKYTFIYEIYYDYDLEKGYTDENSHIKEFSWNMFFE